MQANSLQRKGGLCTTLQRRSCHILGRNPRAFHSQRENLAFRMRGVPSSHRCRRLVDPANRLPARSCCSFARREIILSCFGSEAALQIASKIAVSPLLQFTNAPNLLPHVKPPYSSTSLHTPYLDKSLVQGSDQVAARWGHMIHACLGL